MSASDEPTLPDGLKVERTRVYYSATGEAVHVHQLLSGPGDDMGSERVEAEIKVLEEAIRQRHGDIEYLEVDAADLQPSGGGIRVDVERRTLVHAENDVDGRIDQLAEQARAGGIDWQQTMGTLRTDDPRVVLAALATLLELDVIDVLDGKRPLEETEERARFRAEAAATMERQAQAGQPAPLGGGAAE